MTHLDYAVLALYGLTALALGLRVSRHHQSTGELWLGGRRMPTWTVLFSMVATELSAATFIGVPQAAYVGDWSFLQFAFGALAGKLLLASFVIPLYHRLGVVTVYGLLEHRFGPRSRRAAATCFVGGRLLASGVRFFIAALAFAAVAGTEVEVAILVCGAVAGAYTLYGGIRAVIYTDVLQGVVFVVAAIAVVGSLASFDAGGIGAVFDWAREGDRLAIFTFDPPIALADTRPWLVALIGGFFLTLATHGTDHDMVQRLLAARSGRSGGRALIGSALLNFPLTALFLWIGTGLAFAYRTPPDYDIAATAQVLPLYALHELPSGIRGLFFSGILAAAMSSFDSAVCAISTAWAVDVRPGDEAGGGEGSDGASLRRTRRVTLVVCSLLVAAALAIAGYHRILTASGAAGSSLVDLALSAMTILYGGLLGIFAVAVAAPGRGSDRSAVAGLAVGGVLGLGLFLHPLVLGEVWIAWPWWIPISASLSVAVTLLAKGGDAQGAAVE